MVRDNEPTDDFGNLGHYGVSESSQSVHPGGNPMSHSTHIGLNFPPIADASVNATASSRRDLYGLPLANFRAKFETSSFIALDDRGVGHDDDPVASVIGSHAGRGNNAPFRVIPDGGKVANNR